MKLLLDTHVLLWALGDVANLAPRAAAALRDPANDVIASAASFWEIAIKASLGKLELPGPPADWLLPAVERTGFETLAVEPAHALAAGALPPHHRDPFDRMLIAQAALEDLTFVSRDARLGAYGITILPA